MDEGDAEEGEEVQQAPKSTRNAQREGRLRKRKRGGVRSAARFGGTPQVCPDAEEVGRAAGEDADRNEVGDAEPLPLGLGRLVVEVVRLQEEVAWGADAAGARGRRER